MNDRWRKELKSSAKVCKTDRKLIQRENFCEGEGRKKRKVSWILFGLQLGRPAKEVWFGPGRRFLSRGVTNGCQRGSPWLLTSTG